MKRREFTRSVRAEIIKRAWRGFDAYCEKCGEPTKQRFEIHHVEMDAMAVERNNRLGASEGQLLCLPCHRRETGEQMPRLRKAKAQEARYIGAEPPRKKIVSRGFAKKVRTPKPPVEGVTGYARLMRDAQD